MRLFCVIFGSRKPGSNGHRRRLSPLSLPYGIGTLLDHLVEVCAELACEQVFVVDRRLPVEPEVKPRLEGPPMSRVNALSAAVGSLEPSDTVLVLDARHWPGRHAEIHMIIKEAENLLAATHVRPLGVGQERVIERIERDPNDRVCRIRRLYEPKTWFNGDSPGVAYSLVPALLLHDVECASLGDMRLALARRGVPTQDRTIQGAVVDLEDARCQLSLAESSVVEAAALELLPDHYSRLGPNVLVGRGALIHGSAKITGPVVIQPDSVVEADVTIIGPALIGSDCTIRRGALIARSVVMAGSEAPANAIICDRALLNGGVEPRPRRDQAAFARREIERAHEATLGARPENRIDRIEDRTQSRAAFLAWKRMSDAMLSAFGLIALSPLLLIVAILIKIDSRGPILFVHRREGRGGREFPCFKFRSMRRDADLQQRRLYANNVVDGPQFKLNSDPRITRVGRLLRRTNIDELPQLINVLLGHLSFVGPRPSPFRENQICVPWRQARLSVRPGITGLWQLCRSSNRCQGDFQEWIYYDMAYVRNMSAWLDFKILLATIATLGGQYPVPLKWFIGSNKADSNSAHAGRKRFPIQSIYQAGARLSCAHARMLQDHVEAAALAK